MVVITIRDIIGFIFIILFIIFCLYVWVREKIEQRKQIKAKNCNYCKKQHTMECPNSSKCYNTMDKPYFEIKEKE